MGRQNRNETGPFSAGFSEMENGMNYQEMMQDTFDQIEQIGAGGGGAIFKAHHKRLDKDVVLKKILTNRLSSMEHRGELDILKNLKHPCLPQVFDFIEYGDDVFTVMEYIPGKSFAQLLAEHQKFSQKQVIRWMNQLTEVLVYLHSRKPAIIHCDIKPGNLMLTPEGNICLIDFNISGVRTEDGVASLGYTDGYAPVEQFAVIAERRRKIAGAGMDRGDRKAASGSGAAQPDGDITQPDGDITQPDGDITQPDTDLTQPDTVIPSAGYAASSQNGTASQQAQSSTAAGRLGFRSLSDADFAAACRRAEALGPHPEIDERTDIYSAGATLYYILTGVKPAPFYHAFVPVQEVRPDTSEGLAWIINKALEVMPSDRFRSSEQMLKSVRSMKTIDHRYRSMTRRQNLTLILLLILTGVSVLTAQLGRQRMAIEKQEQYDTAVSMLEQDRKAADSDAVNRDYVTAVSLFPEYQDAYYEMAMFDYEQKDYEGCIDYLETNVIGNTAIEQDENYGRFYYIEGSSYFELEDYPNAITAYRNALQLQPQQISYYRDYVIALARNGQTEEAAKVLQEASDKGITADIISLLTGEIALANKDYTKAESAFEDCIGTTQDDYILLRAYTKLDDVLQGMYTGQEQYDARISLLTEALGRLPQEDQVDLLERLAQVYMDDADASGDASLNQKAIEVFLQVQNMGYGTFTTQYNLSVLYEKTGDFDKAGAILQEMLKDNADSYQIYKRLAFLELDIQNAKDNTERSYQNFREYYDKAEELYQDHASGQDMEMQLLESQYQEVTANGWLN